MRDCNKIVFAFGWSAKKIAHVLL